MPVSKKLKKYIGLAGILFLFPLLWLVFFGIMGKHNFKTLPYFSPTGVSDSAEYMLPDFAFADETGTIITRDSLLGNVWIAACYHLGDPNIAVITERLLNVNFKYRNESDIAIVVFSADCNYDQPPLTAAYVEQNTRYNAFQTNGKS